MEGLGHALRCAMVAFVTEPLEQNEPDDRTDWKQQDGENTPECHGPVGPVRGDTYKRNVEHKTDGDCYAERNGHRNRTDGALDEGWQECAYTEGKDYE